MEWAKTASTCKCAAVMWRMQRDCVTVSGPLQHPTAPAQHRKAAV